MNLINVIASLHALTLRVTLLLCLHVTLMLPPPHSADLTPDRYWRAPVTPLMSANNLIEYMVSFFFLKQQLQVFALV
jgi:hypothetical protein